MSKTNEDSVKGHAHTRTLSWPSDRSRGTSLSRAIPKLISVDKKNHYINRKIRSFFGHKESCLSDCILVFFSADSTA